MSYVTTLSKNTVDTKKLQSEVNDLFNDVGYNDQLSLTSVLGNDDWSCSVGKLRDLQYPERFYGTVNKHLEGTYISKLINQYSDYYRWRLLSIPGRKTYSVHHDSLPSKKNYRIHIPVLSNNESYMCFFKEEIKDFAVNEVYYARLLEGNVYEVDTTGLHTAVNYSLNTRIHIVGVRYEDCDNRNI